MDLEIIETIFTFGKFAALTPSSMNNHNPHCLQKLYELCVFVVYVVSFVLSAFVYRTQYAILTPIQLVLAILFQLNYIFYVFYVVVLVMRLRRSNFFRLIEGLGDVQFASQRVPLKLIFIASQLIYCCLFCFGLYVGLKRVGLAYFAMSGPAFYQNYIQIFYLVFVTILLLLLLSRYELLSQTLSDVTKARRQLHPKKMEEILKKIKFGIVALKKSVNIFNDTFGWTILFNIFSSASKTLVYIDVMIKQLDMLVTKSISLFYYDVCYILTTWVKQSCCPFDCVTSC
jgi:hypothetical protein